MYTSGGLRTPSTARNDSTVMGHATEGVALDGRGEVLGDTWGPMVELRGFEPVTS